MTVCLLGFAYPSPDPEIRDYLCTGANERSIRLRYHIFFKNLFATTQETILTLYPTEPKTKQSITSAELARKWRDYLGAGSKRNNLYKRVIKAADVSSL